MSGLVAVLDVDAWLVTRCAARTVDSLEEPLCCDLRPGHLEAGLGHYDQVRQAWWGLVELDGGPG